MSASAGWIYVVDAAHRLGCSVKTIRARIKRGAVRSVLERRPGRDGRKARKWMVSVEDLDAGLSATDATAYIAELVARAPLLSERQKMRIWSIVKSASTSGPHAEEPEEHDD